MRGIDTTALTEIARLLARHGGHYIFTVDGREYVVAPREDVSLGNAEQQGVLPIGELAERDDEPAGAETAVLERINRDIALYRQHLDDELLGGDVVLEGAGGEIARVRFEPLRGDLPPELQE